MTYKKLFKVVLFVEAADPEAAQQAAADRLNAGGEADEVSEATEEDIPTGL